MKACFVQAIVSVIYYLGVQYLVTADSESGELKDVYFKLKDYTESIKTLEREKLQIEELILYSIQNGEKQFRDEIMRLEELYGAKWILDLFENISPNDRNLLQTYSEYYGRVSSIKKNSDVYEYHFSSIESAIEKKWNARLNFDLATNTYLNMKPSSKNNGKSLYDRQSTLRQTEQQYKESKLSIKSTYKEVIETGLTFRKVYEAVEQDLWKSNPQLNEEQKNNNEIREMFEDYEYDLKNLETKAKNTLDSDERHNLEREIEDLRQKVNDYKKQLDESDKNLNKAFNNLLLAHPDYQAVDKKHRDAFGKYFKDLSDHLKILTTKEVQRIDVLELLSLKERIQIYESIMREESKYSL
ncbi:unnamed protein product [Schistosoma haematobium]|nr:unnamed protein product [Schistosoma haematobium]